MKLIHGDCVEAMREMPEASVDAIVTDPPYNLGFMSKPWDIQHDHEPWAREAFRVLKPGGHLLAFGGTRTYHRLACAIEDAGFEIRDSLMWLYGSGFPKSLNLDGEHHGWGTALKPAHEPIVLARKPLTGTVAQNVLEHGTGALNVDGCRVTAAGSHGTRGRRKFTGFSDGPIYGDHSGDKTPENLLGRWPANLVLSHHPDCEQVGVRRVRSHNPDNKTVDEGATNGVYGEYRQRSSVGHAQDGLETVPDFRCVEGCPVRELDGQSGECKTGALKPYVLNARPDRIYGGGKGYLKSGQMMTRTKEADSGGASRFFYVAKASRRERNAGLPEGERSMHPTVKPLELMRWLCRLVTPPGGTVLDPFLGSGTTGCAAALEGFAFIGIEREEEYLKIAEARIAHWKKQAVQLELAA